MEITIKTNGQAVSVEVSYEVYEYLCESGHKTENLSHQKRRHLDMREVDEYVIATECSHIHIPTPEEIALPAYYADAHKTHKYCVLARAAFARLNQCHLDNFYIPMVRFLIRGV